MNRDRGTRHLCLSDRVLRAQNCSVTGILLVSVFVRNVAEVGALYDSAWTTQRHCRFTAEGT